MTVTKALRLWNHIQEKNEKKKGEKGNKLSWSSWVFNDGWIRNFLPFPCNLCNTGGAVCWT